MFVVGLAREHYLFCSISSLLCLKTQYGDKGTMFFVNFKKKKQTFVKTCVKVSRMRNVLSLRVWRSLLESVALQCEERGMLIATPHFAPLGQRMVAPWAIKNKK